MDQSQKRKFFYAKAYKRILARIIDMVVCMLLSVLLAIAIVGGEKDGFKNATSLESWRYAMITLCVFLIQIIYFSIIPFIFDRTLFQLVFNIKNHNFKNKFLFIFKKELFLSILPSLIILIYGIILWSIGSDYDKVFFEEFRNNTVTTYTLAISLYKIFFGFYGIILFIVFVNTCFKNGYKNVIDYFSNSCVIDLANKTNTPEIIAKVISSSNLPGTVSLDELQEANND